MDSALIHLPDKQMVALPAGDGGGAAIFPQYGFENSLFRLVPGRAVARLRYGTGDTPGPWLECGSAAIPLNSEQMPPGRQHLEVEWCGRNHERGRLSLSYHVRPGKLVEEGPPIDVAFDQDRFYLAHPTGVEVWRRDGAPVGIFHPPSMRTISAISGSTELSLLAVGCRDGVLFLCCTRTGGFSKPFVMGTKEPITTLCFAGRKLLVVCGMRKLFLWDVVGLEQLILATKKAADSDLHSAAMVDGKLQMVSLNLEISGRSPLLRLNDRNFLLLQKDNLTMFSSGQTRKLPLTRTIGLCRRVLHLGCENGLHQLLALTAEGLFELHLEPEGERVEVFTLAPARQTSPVMPWRRFTADGLLVVETSEHLTLRSTDHWADLTASSRDIDLGKPVGGLSDVAASAYDAELAVIALGDSQGRIALVDLVTRKSTVQTVHKTAKTKILGEGESYKEGMHAHVTALCFIPGTPYLLSGGMDSCLYCHEVIGETMVERWHIRDMNGNAQDIVVLDECLFAVTTPLQVTLWRWKKSAARQIGSCLPFSHYLDPLCCSPQGFPLVVGDWGGSIHLLSPVNGKGLKRLWSLSVSPDSLFALHCLDDQYLLAASESKVLILVDIVNRKVVASCSFFGFSFNNRRANDLVVMVGGRAMLAANIMQPDNQDNGNHPLHLIPVEALRWRDGQLFLDERDLLSATDPLRTSGTILQFGDQK